MIKVLFVAAEAAPFAKTGGLGDVIGSLPTALRKQGIEVKVILPMYGTIPYEYKQKMKFLCDFKVPLSWRKQYGGLQYLEHDGIQYFFLENEYYFRRNAIYDYFDEAERFSYLCKGALECLPYMGFNPDIIHCNDWHTGMIPVFLEAHYKGIPLYDRIKTVFTIHNLKFQGVFTHWILDNILGLPQDYFTTDKVEYHGQVNFMKAGIVFSNFLTTVSPTYAEEIKYPFFGETLDGLLQNKAYKLKGILNGISYSSYNPAADSELFVNYSVENADRKKENKTSLQKMLGLPISANTPMLGFVSRLTKQKGLDLLVRVIDEILDMDIQLVILGTGNQEYEYRLFDVANRYPGKMRVNTSFNESLARKIYAASDIFLMPSLFEPCGLSQLIAMHYGTIPIVRETGGLKDTITPYHEYIGKSNGFSFYNFNAHDFLYAIQKAVKLYRNTITWDKLVKNAMMADFSWEKSALEYKNLYESVIGGIS